MSNVDRRAAQSEIFEDYGIFYQFLRGQKARLDFLVVRVAGLRRVDDRDEPIYSRWVSGKPDWDCTDPAEADVLLEGLIKFDGESSWDVTAEEVNFGNLDEALGWGRLMQRMYEIAASQIDGFDVECNGMTRPSSSSPAGRPVPSN
jgi:hypothetical protein